VAADDRPTAVQAFLTELGQLSETLGLVVAAVDPRSGAWADLPTLITMSGSQNGWQDIDRLHLRVYGPEDYLRRLRQYVASEGGFSSIPEPAAVPTVGSVELDLKARMDTAGVTQTELAEHLGKKRPYVTAVLNGKRPWPRGDLLERCEAFVASRERESGGN